MKPPIRSIRLQLKRKMKNPEYRQAFFHARVLDEIAIQLNTSFQKSVFNRTELAVVSGMHKSRISEILNSGPQAQGMTIKTLARLADALDLYVDIRLKPINKWLDGKP